MQNIFDKTFMKGKVPDIWKEANITALYKNKGDKSDTTNYRPVSLTYLPSRLCEKTVRDSIMNHMTLNNLFTDCQFGFRLGASIMMKTSKLTHIHVIPPGSCGRLPNLNPISRTRMRATQSPAF